MKSKINIKTEKWSKDFIREMESRSKSFKDGSAKTYTWEETKLAAINRVKVTLGTK